MNNKLIYLLVMLASVSAVYGQIQVVKTAFNQDKNTNTAFNSLTAVAATAGQKLIVTINQEGPHKLNILSVQYGKSDFTLAVQDDASSFKLAEIWYLDVTHDIVSDIVIKYCDSSAKDPVPCNARSAVGLMVLNGAAVGGPINTHTVSRTQSSTPGAVSYEFAAGKDACFVVGAYVQNNGQGQPKNPTQFSSVLAADCGSSNAAVGYSLPSQSGPISYQWSAPAGFEIHPDNAVALASFAPRATK